MWKYGYEDEGYNICDGIRGVVICGCSKGLFLSLENGEEAFAYFSRLEPGTEVLCSIIKKSTENLRVWVSIDSVYERRIAA